MSLDRCFTGLELDGKIDAPRSKEARALYEELKTFYGRSHDEETAAALASAETVKRLELASAHKKRNLVRQQQAQANALVKGRSYDGGDPAADGPIDPRGFLALFRPDERAGHNDNVITREEAIKGRAHGMIAEILQRFHQNVFGSVRHRAELVDLVREIFTPGSTGNQAAREMADAWGKAAEYLRARFNEAGGAIGKLDNWGLPQGHDSFKIREAGYQAWRDFTAPLLDRNRMIDRRTGEPFTDAALEPVLRQVYETLHTDGWATITPGAAGGKMLANQKAEHRFLHFDGADAWMAYADKFGSGNAFDAMMGHVAAMSRDTALMEILGPNPAQTVRWLQDTLNQLAERHGDGKAIDAAQAAAPKVQRFYDEITGTLRRPENRRLALGFSAVRAVQTSAKLGSAMLSAITDAGFGAMTRAYNGLPMWKMVGSYAKMLNPASAEDRLFAVRAGLIAEEWASIASTTYRYLQEEMTGEVARRLSHGVLTASGLQHWTQAGRWAFGMEFLGHITDQSVKSFDQLDAPFRSALQRNGIGAAGWEELRHTPLEMHKGVPWILPGNIESQALGDRVLQMIATERNYAVPMTDLDTRAMMNSLGKRGTVPGELVRSALLFKTFGISVMLLHGRRAIQAGGWYGAGYAAGLTIATTALGALALQLKLIAGEKDPAPMNTPEFVGKAALQGGGFGIFGDFLGSSENRFGGGLAQTAAGPLAQTAQNVLNLTAGNAFKAARGDKTHVGRDFVQLLRQETPGGSLWYARQAYNRLVLDQLQAAVDPDYRKSWRRMESKARQQGTPFYWEPGELTPERGPDIKRALMLGEGGQ